MSGTLTSRRNVVLSAGAVACAALTPPLVAAAATVASGLTPVIRKNIDSLSEEELATYAHAVGLLRAQAADDSTPVYHPALRGAVTPLASMAGRPWDRRHLEAIEQRLRATDPPRTASVSVPYWDFTKPASGLVYAAAFERPDSPLLANAGDGDPARLDPVFWSYHAYIITVEDQWRLRNDPLPRGTTSHLWIGPNAVEIRTSRRLHS